MELVTEKLTIKLDGVVHDLSYPTVKQIKSLEKPEEDFKIDEVMNFLVDCGLPLEVVERLQANHLNQIIGALVGKQKV